MKATHPIALLPDSLNLDHLFAPGGYRFSMGLTRMNLSKFFGNLEPKTGCPGTDLLETRKALLVEDSEEYVCQPPDQADSEQVVNFASRWLAISPKANFRDLGGQWEPDFVLLRRERDRSADRQAGPELSCSPVVIGGCVCFPSGWSLREKFQKPLPMVHGPVPGLNEKLRLQIDRMLGSIQPEDCYQRTNWGLSTSERLNQHPNQSVEKISPQFDPAKTYVRIEWQALTALDDFRLLFGIRVYHFSLEIARENPRMAQMLATQLDTMPKAMAEYKRVEECRATVISYLADGN